MMFWEAGGGGGGGGVDGKGEGVQIGRAHV